MNIKTGETAPFRAFFEDTTGTGVTGLTVTWDIYNPAGAKVVTNGAAAEIGGGAYSYSQASATAGAWLGIAKTASTAVASKHRPSMVMVGYAGADYLDASISGIDDLVWAYASRTLTQPAAAVIAAVSGSVLNLVRGTTWTIALTGLGSLTGNSKIYFTMKESVSQTDAASIVQVEKTGGLLVLNGATTTTTNATLVIDNEGLGNITITVKPAATTTVESDTLIYDVKMITATGAAQLLTSNLARVADHITRAIT